MNSKGTTVILAVLLVSLSALALVPCGTGVAGENLGTASGDGITVEYADSSKEGFGIMTVTFVKTPNDTEYTITIDGKISAPIKVTEGWFTVPGGLSAGAHTLVIQCGDDTWNLTMVVNEVIHATGIDIAESSLSLTKGEKRTLTAVIIPEGAVEEDIIWSSSDDTVVTVHNGTVTAVATGTATITASITSPEGTFEDTCTVSVREQSPTPSHDHTHSWGTGKVIREATCTEDGVIQYACSCGDTRTVTVPALGHQWSEWKVVKPATATEYGLEERTCQRCGEKETQIIEKLGPGGDDPDKPISDDNDRDNDNTVLYIAIAGAAIAALVTAAAVLILRKP